MVTRHAATAPTLHAGHRGPAVRRLQRMLRAAGFDPGLIDGDFGVGTEAALIAFQRSSGLLPDGVAGPRTLHALGLATTPELPSAIDRFSVQVTARMFPGAPLGRIKAYRPLVLDAMAAQALHDRAMLLMALATIRAESAGFAPVDEGRSRHNTSPNGHPFDLYDQRRDLGNTGPPDGERYKGRGFVQLTGRFNYTLYAERTGETLVDEPARANEPAIAAALLALFLKDKEAQIKQALLEHDLARARRLVNGGSHGLAAFTDAWAIGEALTREG
jgi:peptidoglycan L-alanyl-D-glutamate endopeptidase CwlK